MCNRFMQPLRVAVQWLFLCFIMYLGVSFYRFVLFCRGESGIVVPRPDGIEGFLPISALVSLKGWLLTGEINAIHPAGLVIFLTILGISFLLKRSFCSWLCPVGTLSELCWKGGFNLFRRNFRPPLWLDRGLRGIKYLLLCFFLLSIGVLMAPERVSAFISSDYNKIADIRMLDFFLHPSLLSLTIMGVLVLLSFPVKNAFCRFLCPYGALLGLVSMLSPVKVTRDRQLCVSCGVCSQACPSYLPVMITERVHSPECIGCWRCVAHCPVHGALEMKLTGGRFAVPGLLFALLVVLLFWGGTMTGKLSGTWRTAIPLQEYLLLSRDPMVHQ
jgi:polyferredoxin